MKFGVTLCNSRNTEELLQEQERLVFFIKTFILKQLTYEGKPGCQHDLPWWDLLWLIYNKYCFFSCFYY